MLPAFGSSTLDIYVCMWQFDLVFSVASWECAFWVLQLPQSISLLLYIAIKVITWDPTHTGVKYGTRKFSHQLTHHFEIGVWFWVIWVLLSVISYLLVSSVYLNPPLLIVPCLIVLAISAYKLSRITCQFAFHSWPLHLSWTWFYLNPAWIVC